MKQMKHFVKGVFRKLGFEVKRYRPYGIFEVQITTLLKQIRPDVVLDIGANTGQYAQALRSNGFDGNIISFEPLSDAYAELVKNSIEDKCWTIAPRMAIGDFNGETSIHVAGNSQSSSIMQMLPQHETAEPTSKYITTETTPIYTLDSLLGNIIPDCYKTFFVKIDVQGFESKVLDGIKNNYDMIKGIQVELSTVPLYSEQKLYHEIIDFLVKQEFYLHAITPTFIDKLTGRLLQFDGVFAK